MSEDSFDTQAMQNRLRFVLNSDRAILSPIELATLQARIAAALSDLMILDMENIEFSISRSGDSRILELKLPVRSFLAESGSEEV